ncbi:hypothetical protein PR002_g17814 [Phytophthora rubi]|uniref:Uncharacterized protein n=1 Tax=Phytophthora rubi TaxID=129364 RepID=A0A6A3KCL6_9STRA|nr:hypothetical protein PR002_g17814 [Phytophthora rubi]
MQSCSTARAQFTRGSTLENDCELIDEVVDAVGAAEGEVGTNTGLLRLETFPSKSNITSTFSYLDAVRLDPPREPFRLVGLDCCGENANTLAPASGALITVSSFTSGKNCVLLVATTRVLARLPASKDDELLVLLLSFLAAGRLLFPTDHEISDAVARLSSRDVNVNADEDVDAPNEVFLLAPSRSPRLENDDDEDVTAFFLGGSADARELRAVDETVAEKNLGEGEDELPPASGELDQAKEEEEEVELFSSLGVRVVRFCHRSPLLGDAAAGLL